MKTNKIIADFRKDKGWKHADLANKTDILQVMAGKYERDSAFPSLYAAKKIANAFGVFFDYMVGEGINAQFDKKTVQRTQELELPEKDKKKTLFDLMDTYIREAKTRQAYAAG